MCNGPGAIYECGVLTSQRETVTVMATYLSLGGGDCSADADADGVCDDVDDCVGAYDDCGV